MSASVKIRRTMKRKDGNAKATIKSALKVVATPQKVSVRSSKKITPNVRAN